MTVTEFFAVFGIFAIMWWIGRRVAQALDRYELMKRQCKTGAVERRIAAGEPRKTRVLSYSGHPRPTGSR